MAVIETWFEQDLQKAVQVQHLNGSLFSNNANGNRIGVVVYNNGVAASLSGTVSGYAVLPDGTTVPCTGSLSGNRASVLIPAAAYQPGIIFVSVFLTSGSTVTTLAAVAANVQQARTDSQVSPGSAVTDWTQTINAAMQSVVTANAANMAVEYGSLTYPVPVGKYTIYNDLLYMCTTPIATAESWTASHWTRVRIADEVSDLKSALNDTQDKIKRLDNGIGTLDGNFVIGNLDKTTVYPNNKYTVCNPTIQQYDRDIVFTIKPGFKINVNFFDSEGERTAAYSNRTGTFTVPKDTRFNLSIRRNPEDTSEVITDIDEFVNAVTFSSGIEVRLEALEADSTEYKQNFGDISDNVTSETLSFEYGNIENGTGIIKNGTYVRTRSYIKACAGDVISAKYINYNNNPTGVQLNGYEYDEYGALIGGATAGWKNSYTVTKDCNLLVLFNNNLSIESSTSRAVSPSEFKATVTINYVRSNFVINGSLVDLRTNETVKSITNTFLSNTVKTIAHRGDDIVAPQNTAPAYIEARRRGILIAENDVFISSDGVYVMWHDSSLSKLGNLVDVNGYLVYTDGTDFYYYDATNETLYTYSDADDEYVPSLVDVSSLTRCAGANYSVTDLTYAVLKRIDFGVYKNEQYKGTHILTFGEWVLLCKQLGMSLYIDSKITFTESDLTALMNVVKNMGMVSYATWINVRYSLMPKLRELDPSARVGLLSNPTQELINAYSTYLAGGEVFFDGTATGLTSASAALALSNGFGLECYYVDFGNKTPENVYEQIRSFVALGVTGITIDHYRADEAFQYLFITN